jgi:hypothetical protein
MKTLETLPGLLIAALMLLAYAACLSGCGTHFDRDPLAAYSVDPGAFGVPVTTFATVPF